jgi:hypothetical protein
MMDNATSDQDSRIAQLLNEGLDVRLATVAQPTGATPVPTRAVQQRWRAWLIPALAAVAVAVVALAVVTVNHVQGQPEGVTTAPAAPHSTFGPGWTLSFGAVRHREVSGEYALSPPGALRPTINTLQAARVACRSVCTSLTTEWLAVVSGGGLPAPGQNGRSRDGLAYYVVQTGTLCLERGTPAEMTLPPRPPQHDCDNGQVIDAHTGAVLGSSDGPSGYLTVH